LAHEEQWPLSNLLRKIVRQHVEQRETEAAA
jgi:hypothetical protein